MRETQQAVLHEDVRDSILDAVGHLLEKYGYRKMTVDDIAHEAGIGKGTVYLYFPSKEEVALSWFDRVIQELAEELWKIARSEAEPADKLRKFLLRRVLFAFDHVQRFVLSIDELFAAIRPSLLARRDRYHAMQTEILRKILEDGLACGAFRVKDVAASAQALVLATNSLLPYSLSTSELGRRDEIEAKTELIADIVLNGLLSRSARCKSSRSKGE